MHPLDPYRAATILIQEHGSDALAIAAERMLDMKLANDKEGESVWGRVFNAIQDLKALRPGNGRVVH